MANTEYVYWGDPECNAGTSVYTTTKVDLATVFLWTAEFRIPPGHAGLTGIALVDSGHFVVPFDATGEAWLVGDDDLLSYAVNNELGSNVSFATYNTDDTYNHGWQVRLVYTPMSDYVPDGGELDVLTVDLSGGLV